LRHGQRITFSELQSLLTDKNQTSPKPVVLIEYFCTDDVTLVFGVRADWDEPKMAEIKVPVLDIRRKTASFFGNDSDEHHTVIRLASEKIQNLDEDEWQAEFNKFIAPIREWANEGDIVWIVPHDALHYLPMHALKLDGRYLIERNPVVYAPSASVMKYCQLKRKGKHEHALVLGDSLGNLPHARDEARTVAAIFRSRAYLQSDATKQVVMEKLRVERTDIDIFHFACHGSFDPFQPLQSGIELAKNGEENLSLTAEEIFALEMRAELVVLSACESGVNQHKPGDELIGNRGIRNTS
jgi:CHAT domain-containing protein